MFSWCRSVGSESSLGAFWIAKDVMFLHADNEDPDLVDHELILSLRLAHMSEGTFSHVSARTGELQIRTSSDSWLFFEMQHLSGYSLEPLRQCHSNACLQQMFSFRKKKYIRCFLFFYLFIFFLSSFCPIRIWFWAVKQTVNILY